MINNAKIDEQWTMRKDAILDLYIKKSRPLKEVITSMAEQGFQKTKPQYERALKIWGVSKNITTDEWTFIVARLEERETHNKPTAVEVRGSSVPASKIRKQRRLYESQTFDRLASRLGTSARPSTPPGVLIFTPAASPGSDVPCDIPAVGQNRRGSASHRTSDMPYKHFQRLLTSLSSISSAQSKNKEELAVVSVEQFESSFNRLSSSLEDSSCLQGIKLNSKRTSSPPDLQSLYRTLSDYLPGLHLEPLLASTGEACVLANTGLDIVRQLIVALSNNIELQEIPFAILGLAKDRRTRFFLTSLLSRRSHTVSAFAQMLLVPAARQGHLDLVKSLIEHGLDLDLRHGDPEPMTALQYAVDKGNISLVNVLLENGARDHCATFWGFDGFVQGTILDLAIERDHYDVVVHLLNFPMATSAKRLRVTLCTLKSAVLLGRVEIVRLLLTKEPWLRSRVKTQTWVYYEAAAFCEDMNRANTLIDLLHRETSLKQCSEVSSEHASISAPAARQPNMAAKRKILGGETSVVSCPAASTNPCPNISCGCKRYDNKFRGFRGYRPLYAAITNGHRGLVKLFLSHGINVNEASGVYPIQLAAFKGESETVRLLVEYDADVNATCADRNHDTIPGLSCKLPALRLALLKKNYGCAEVLLHAGASLYVKHPKEEQDAVLEALIPELVNSRACDAIVAAIQQYLRAKGKILNKHHAPVKRLGIGFFDAPFSKIDMEPTPYLPLFKICAAILRGEVTLMTQLVAEIVREPTGIPSHYGTRLLILAVTAPSHSENMVLVLLRLGISQGPFALVGSTEDEILKKLDREYGLSNELSAFRQSTKFRTERITRIFLTLRCEYLCHGQRVLRYRQMCEAYTWALCKGYTWLSKTLSQYGIGHQDVARTFGPSHLRVTLQKALLHAIKRRAYGEMRRILSQPDQCGDLVNLTAQTSDHSPLQYLSLQNQSQHVCTLLELGADVNAPPRPVAGATALQFAAMNGNFTVATMLIKAGANINAQPSPVQGRTAIEGAAEWGRLDMVHYLLDCGADICDRSIYRRTIYRAWLNGHNTIVRMVYEWKKERSDEECCESPGSVVRSMTEDELDCPDVSVHGFELSSDEDWEYDSETESEWGEH